VALGVLRDRTDCARITLDFELTMAADEKHSTVLETDPLRVAHTEGDRGSFDEWTNHRNPIDAPPLAHDCYSLAGDKTPSRNGKSRLQGVLAKEDTGIFGREANESRAMGFAYGHGSPRPPS
jgi:hypothetical protein